MALKQKYTPSVNAIFTRLDDGESVLLQFEKQKYYTLNSTGSFIWDAVCKDGDVVSVEDALVDEFGLEREHASKTVSTFISQLVDTGLLDIES